MIILEGPDHIGKTTVAKRICEFTGWKYEHLGVPDKDWDYFIDYLCRLRPNTVWDRFHLGGWVYGHQLGLHKHELTEDRMYLITNFINKVAHYTTIILYTEKWFWLENHLLSLPKKELYSHEEILEVNDCYYALSIGNFNSDQGKKVKCCDIAFDVSENKFPTDKEIKEWISYSQKKQSANGSKTSLNKEKSYGLD